MVIIREAIVLGGRMSARTRPDSACNAGGTKPGLLTKSGVRVAIGAYLDNYLATS